MSPNPETRRPLRPTAWALAALLGGTLLASMTGCSHTDSSAGGTTLPATAPTAPPAAPSPAAGTPAGATQAHHGSGPGGQ